MYEAAAKQAYETFQHRAGSPIHLAWEQIPERERQAWREVIQEAKKAAIQDVQREVDGAIEAAIDSVQGIREALAC